MFRLSTTCLRYFLEDFFVAADEVNEALRADSVFFVDTIKEVERTINHFVGFVAQNVHHGVELGF